MAGRYKPYPEYKDTGAQWLGLIPNHWDIFDGKRVFNNRRELASESDEQLAASQRYGVVPQSLMMEMNDSKVMLALKGTSSFRHVERNDYVISLRSFEGGIEHSNYVGCVSPAYTVLSAIKPIVPSFYKYFFKSKPYIAALQSTTDSLRDGKSITFDQFGSIPLVLPCANEQRAIANFLDHETAKIDTLIEKQQQLIQLLKEKRQAVINHAVTKGLNPNAKMKDSGVEWLGEVPEHWVLSKVKYEYESLDGRRIPLSTIERSSMQGEFPYYGASGVIDHVDSYIFDEDLVLVSEDGANLIMRTYPIAFPAYGKYWVNNHAHILRPKDQKVEFWSEVIEVRDLSPYVTGSAQPKFTSEALNNLQISVPPTEDEVSEIAFYIERQKDKYKLLIENAERSIELMHERRTALISAAVTGKIDVRNWVAPNESQANKEEAA